MVILRKRKTQKQCHGNWSHITSSARVARGRAALTGRRDRPTLASRPPLLSRKPTIFPGTPCGRPLPQPEGAGQRPEQAAPFGFPPWQLGPGPQTSPFQTRCVHRYPLLKMSRTQDATGGWGRGGGPERHKSPNPRHTHTYTHTHPPRVLGVAATPTRLHPPPRDPRSKVRPPHPHLSTPPSWSLLLRREMEANGYLETISKGLHLPPRRGSSHFPATTLFPLPRRPPFSAPKFGGGAGAEGEA